MKDVRKEVASCLRQVLEGKVSWDHFLEEFQRHKDAGTAEVMELVESLARKYDRYSKPIELQEEERKKLDSAVRKLEGSAGRKDDR